jgi:hypothetical protein
MTHIYFGSGPSEFTNIEIEEFAESLTDSITSNSFIYQTKRVGLNKYLQSVLDSDKYTFSAEDLLVGSVGTVYWQDSDDQDYGGIGVSIPSSEEATEETVEELLPTIAGAFTEHFFNTVGVKTPDNYDVDDFILRDYDIIETEAKEEPTIETITAATIVVDHIDVNATLYWYGRLGPDFINFYGIVGSKTDERINSASSAATSVTLSEERILSTDVDIDPVIVGGFNWKPLPQSPIKRFKTPVFDSDLFVEVDNPEIDSKYLILIGEEAIFPIPNGQVKVQSGHSKYNTYTPPDDWIPVNTNLNNEWDNVIYYKNFESDGMEVIHGRVDFSSEVFIKFRVDVESGFIGSDNYYKLIQFFEQIEPRSVEIEEVFADLYID